MKIKIIFFLLIIFISAFTFYNQYTREKNRNIEKEKVILHSAYFKEYMQHKKKLDKLKNKHSYKIIMLGDSLTAGNNWNKSFHTNIILNMGQGGDYTELKLLHNSLGLINRLHGLDSKYKKAFLMIGINDFIAGKAVDTVFNSYKKIIHTIQNNKITLIIQSTLYITKNKYNFNYIKINKKVLQLNILLQKYCNNNKIQYINLNSVLSHNKQLITQFTYDGVHLKKEGYNKWVQKIKPYIQKKEEND